MPAKSTIFPKGPSVSSILYAGRTEETLQPAEKAFRDAFIQEFRVDFCGWKALARCGAPGKTKGAMMRQAHNLLRETYVAQRLSAAVREIRPHDVVNRQQVLSKLWEEANNDSENGGMTRVAALAQLGKMMGMTGKEGESTAPVGVMLIPMVSPSTWEQDAATAQELLKQRASLVAAVPPAPPIPPPFQSGKN